MLTPELVVLDGDATLVLVLLDGDTTLLLVVLDGDAHISNGSAGW